MAGRFRRSYTGGQRRTSKQDENGERPHPVSHHPTVPRRPHGFHLIPSSTQSPRPTTSTTRRRTRRRGKRTRRRTAGGQDKHGDDGDEHEGRRNENARPRTTTSKQQDAQRDDKRDARQQDGGRDETQAARAKASKNGRREHEKREEQNAPFSNLSPDPLPPPLYNPTASISSPAPGRGMSGQAIKFARHRRSSVARRVPITHALASSAIAPRVRITRRISSSPASSFQTRRFR